MYRAKCPRDSGLGQPASRRKNQTAPKQDVVYQQLVEYADELMGIS